MRSFPECKACILGTAGRIVDLCHNDTQAKAVIVTEGGAVFDRHDPQLSPAELSHHVFTRVHERLGNHDPFAGEKRNQNAAALALRGELEALVANAADPLYCAVKLSVAGNIIDLGAQQSFDMLEGIQRALTHEFRINDYAAFRARVAQARSLLYILDNAGEIVFDAVMLATLEKLGRFERIEVVVRRKPMLNDVTRADAELVGLAGKYPILDSGSEIFGLPLRHASAEFMARFLAAELIIAKGMANFETLDDAPRDVFFVLMAKCGPISRHLGVQPKDLILKHHAPAGNAQTQAGNLS